MSSSSNIPYTNILTGELSASPHGNNKSKVGYAFTILFTVGTIIAELAFTIFSFYIAATNNQPNAQNCLMDRHRALLYSLGSIEIISTIVNLAYFCILIAEGLYFAATLYLLILLSVLLLGQD